MNGTLLQVKVLFIIVVISNKLFPQNVILNIIYHNGDPNHNKMYERYHKKKKQDTGYSFCLHFECWK